MDYKILNDLIKLYLLFKKMKQQNKANELLILSPYFAYRVALIEGPNKDTRNAVLSRVSWSYFYALCVDKEPSDDTRNVILSDPRYSCLYARDVDKKFREDTFNVIKGSGWEKKYIREVSGTKEFLTKQKGVI